MTRAAILLLVPLLALGCRKDPVHPRGAQMFPAAEGVIATFDGRGVTPAEVREFAGTREKATVAGFVERERLVSAAVDQDTDVDVERKRAMVQALLEDEIEKEIGVDQVDPQIVDARRAAVREELRGPAGFRAAVVRVASLDLIQKKASLSRERKAELRELVKLSARQLYDAVGEEDSLNALVQLKVDGVDPAISVEKSVDLRIAAVGERARLPRDWIRAELIADALAAVEDGGRTKLIEWGDVPVFAVRRERVEAKMPDEEEIERLAVGRAVAEKRRERLETLLERLRGSTTIVLHPELLEEDR